MPVESPLFVCNVIGHGQGRASFDVQCPTSGVTTHDVGRVLLKLATEWLLNPPQRLASITEAQALRAAQEVLDRFPAVAYWPEATPQAVSICADCMALYDDLLAGGHFPLPTGTRVPCDFHLRPELRPLPLEEAIERKAQDPPGS